MKKILTIHFVLLTILVGAQDKNVNDIDSTDKLTKPDAHAPIGVMGDHMHKKGEIMFSYRFMTMWMSGNMVGSDEISDDEIVTTIPNRFAMMPNMPPTLRIVPQDMQMNMHMLGVMYAPTDWLTLMLMGSYLTRNMELKTYQGMMGTTVLGNFKTNTSGIGDTRIVGLVKIWKTHSHLIIGNIGFSIPTASIKEEGEVLTPMNMRITMRFPYPMQMGSGSFDLLPGLTYNGKSDNLSWGGQLMSTIRLSDNKEDYNLGNRFQTTAWLGVPVKSWLSASLRGVYSTQQAIEGIDDDIMGPVQTADPDMQGGSRLDVNVGVNILGQSGFTKGHRLAFEYYLPVYQNLNGPQMATKGSLMVGWQYAF